LDSLAIVSSVAPCILWIDEIEKGFSPTDSQTDGGVSKRILGTFLNFLQERESPIFVVATSNALTSLPPEMLRKGRWDEIFFIDLPSLADRRMIFQVLIDKYGVDLKVDEDLLSLSKGYSGSEIEQAFINSAYEAAAMETAVHWVDIKRNLRGIVPLSISMGKIIETLREWGNAFAIPVTRIRKNAPSSQSVISFRSRGERIS
jgi:SpoVK/Ycf46/Vps4 family AAA+-type ATPase